MRLKSDKYKIIKITKPIKAVFFKDLKVGDIIQIEKELQHIKKGNYGLYASEFIIRNVKTRTFSTRSEIEMMNRLINFKLIKIEGE